MRILTITVLMIAAVAAAVYFHFVRHSEQVFTHFFYIPSILAALWWKRRGLAAPIILAIALIGFHYAQAGMQSLGSEFVRAGILLLVTLVVAELSLKLEQSLVRDVDRALKVSEANYRSLFEGSPMAMARITRDGTIRLANRRFAELTGYSVDELTEGMELDQVLAEGEVEKALSFHQERGLAEPAEYETKIRSRAGQERIVRVNLNPVAGTDEDVAILEDITERRMAERQIAESEEKYRTLIDAFPHSIVIVQDRKVAFANPVTLSMFGYESMDEVVGTGALSRVAERERTRLAEFMAAREQGDPDVPDHYYTVFLRKDGSEFVAEVIVRQITYAGRPAQQLIIVDVTEQRAAEEALKKSEKEKQLILDSITELVIFYGTDFRIVWANRAAADSISLSPADLAGKKCYELWHQRSEPCEGCAVLKALKSGEPHRFEIQSPDGRCWYIRGYPVKDGTGSTVGVVEITLDITASRKADEALQQVEQLYRATIEATKDFIFVRDREGRYVAFNESSLRPLGIKPSDVLGKTAAELEMVPLENRTLWDEMHNHVLQSGNPVSYEDTLVLKDRVRVIETGLWPIKDNSGDVTHVAGIGRDITERKRAEEAVRESEMRYRTLVEQSQDPVAVIQGFFHVYVNEAYCRLLGYADASELIGKPLEATIAPADREMVRKRYQQRLAGERVPPVYELRLMRRDGTELWVEVSVQRRNFLGTPAIQASYRNITERKQIEQTLRESEERYRTTFECTGTAMLLADGEDRIVMANTEFERLTGYTKEEILGKMKWHEVVAEEDLERMRSYSRQRRNSSGAPSSYECSVVMRDGSRKRVFVNVQLIPGTDLSVASCLDITQLKVTEERLRATELRLASLVERLPNVVLYETGGGREFISKNIEGLLGYSADSLTKDRQAFPRLIHPDDQLRVKEAIANWHQAGEPGVLRTRFRVRRADGQYIWLEDQMIIVRPESEKQYMSGVLIALGEQDSSQQ